MSLAVCFQLDDLRRRVGSWRAAGERIAFVPTMGNLHAGHLSLVELAKQKAERVVVSIYVNPMQFAPDEDFASYPRTLDDDLEKLAALDVDLVFTPDTRLVYPQGKEQNSTVDVPGLSDILEGEFRPGFFRGVATVVLKLFNMVQPDIAIFGEKDYQQLLVIRKMVADFNLPVEILGGPIKREADGLAMSSRNSYLDTEERASSRLLSESLARCREDILKAMPVTQAENSCVDALSAAGFIVDYVSLRDPDDLQQVSTASEKGKKLILLAAARMGTTRLIDNLQFTTRP